MAKQVQFRRGTTSQHSSFTGAAGEITIDTDKNIVVVHNGSTAGGIPLAKEANLTSILTTASGAYDKANSANVLAYGTGIGANAYAASVGVNANTWANTKVANGSAFINGTVQPLALNETQTAPAISSGTLTLDCSTGNIFKVSLNANITTLTFSNVPAANSGYGMILSFTADGTARTITWGSAVKWPGGTSPTLTSTNAKVDTFVLMTWDNGTTWYAFTGGQNA